jgi:hypothetical protein
LSFARLIDLEIISSRGDLYGLFARCSGVVLALSLMLVVMVVAPYMRQVIPASPYGVRVRNDEEFLISITLTLAGLFSVLAWNNVLPDRRDCLVLGILPVRIRTIALARLAAIGTCIAALVVLANALTGFAFPLATATGPWDSMRSIAAWWVTMPTAGIFVLSWTLALQGTAARLLRWHTFLRVSGVLQLASLFTVLGFFFLTPPFAATLADNNDLIAFLPSYWFTGLLQTLKGNRDPIITGLAAMAVRNLALIAGLAGCVFALSWLRNMRSIVESPDITSSGGQALVARCGNLLVKCILRRPLDRAILLFIARTAVRSRQHRLLLAAYGGIGFALAVSFSRGLFGVTPAIRWNQPNVPLLVVGMLLLVCAVIATRAIFTLPHSLPANWIFRITAVQNPVRYFEAVRKSLIFVAAFPAWFVCAGAYMAIWPGKFSVAASLILMFIGLILVDYSLYRFRKLPFACSWLPASGQSVNTVRAIAYAFVFLAFAAALGNLELAAIGKDGRFLAPRAPLAAWAAWLRWRGWRFAYSAASAVQFDDAPESEIFSLDLRPD